MRYPKFTVVLLISCSLGGPIAAQSLPNYDLVFLGAADGVSGLSETGVVIGQSHIGNATRGWVASATSPMQLLPLAPGDKSSWANDVNELGVIVGASSTSGTSPEFGARAVAWHPDGQGGYVLQELGMLPGHVGGNATAVNNVGDVVGYSQTGMFRYPVWFTSPTGVMDLNPFGVFDPQSINDQRQFCDRFGKRMDLDTLAVQSLGLPPGPLNYQATLGYSINESGDVAGTAVLTTSTSCVYQAARYLEGSGWEVISPCSPLANASVINDLRDVIYQAFLIYRVLHLEGLGEYNVQDLLAPSAAPWQVLTSFNMDINSSRQLAVTATNPDTGVTGAALLTQAVAPTLCQPDLGFGGPGSAVLQLCGGDLSAGTSADLTLTGAAASQPLWLAVGLQNNPLPLFGGTLVPNPVLVLFPGASDAFGAWSLDGVAGISFPLTLLLQVVQLDPLQAFGVGISNALQVDFGP